LVEEEEDIIIFKRKKNEDKKIEILDALEKLLNQDFDLKTDEKKILLDYKERFQKSQNIEFELVHLRNALLPLVISSELSEPTLKFYKKIRADRKIRWGEGSSLITGISEFPRKEDR
jgi:hypothetical protein